MQGLKTISLAILLGFSSHAFSAWTLDNANSRLNFISIKKGDIAEIHHFTQLSGQVDDSGKANLEINLGSVENQYRHPR